MPIEAVLYTKPGCGLCDEARAELVALAEELFGSGALHLVEIDIRSDAQLEQTLFDRIPVIDVGGVRVEAPIARRALRAALEQAAKGS